MYDMAYWNFAIIFSAWDWHWVIDSGKRRGQSCARLPQQSGYWNGIFDTGKTTLSKTRMVMKMHLIFLVARRFLRFSFNKIPWHVNHFETIRNYSFLFKCPVSSLSMILHLFQRSKNVDFLVYRQIQKRSSRSIFLGLAAWTIWTQQNLSL